MSIRSASCRALLEQAASPSSRTFHSASALLASRDESSSAAKSKKINQRRKEDEVSDTLLTASRLGGQAARIEKAISDRFSGWKPTPGPSSRRNAGRPPLSPDARKSLARATSPSNLEHLLGAHSNAVLSESLTDVDSARPGAKISARDFVMPRRDLRPGDFVEIRRKVATIGIVLPVPEDEMPIETDADDKSKKVGHKDLYVLVTTGSVVLYRDTDVMFQIPNVIEPELVQAAAPTSRRFVVTTNSHETPVDTDGSYEDHSAGTSADADPIDGAALQEEPIDQTRFEARAAICTKMRILERQKERELQRLLPSFQSLFLVPGASQQSREVAKLRNKRTDLRTGTITTYEAAKLMQELYEMRASRAPNGKKKVGSREPAPFTASTVYAAYALLIEQPSHFLADGLSHRKSQLFNCRSEAERANLATISGWIAAPAGSEGQGFIDSFCRKASKVRQWSESQQYDASGAPRVIDTPEPLKDIEWTAEDRAIIEFLQISLGSRRELQADTHGSIASEIIKRAGGHFRLLPHPNTKQLLGLDEAARMLLTDSEQLLGRAILETVGTDLAGGPDLQHALVTRFLTEIGAMPPWRNPTRLDATFRSAMMSDDGGEPERDPTEAERAQPTVVDSKSIAKTFGVSTDEQVEAIRHDFGRDHPVYVIDDETAFELDDGVSVESVPGREKEQAWVHVHIADPTAWMQPGDSLAKRSERRFSTLYFPEARWAMLPDDFVRSGVGLRSSSSSDSGDHSEGQRVMTFSALVDLSSGLVQDTKVRPAFVHDVQAITYKRASELIAGAPPAASEARRAADLSLLSLVATRLSENRTRSTALFPHRPTSSVSVAPLPLPDVPASASALQRPYFFAGFPQISLSSRALDSQQGKKDEVPAMANFVVAEFMILAGRVAAAYGAEHGLAMAYRYQNAPQTRSVIEELLAMRTNMPDLSTVGAPPVSPIDDSGLIAHGLVPYDDLIQRGITLGSGGYSVRFGPHFSLGITAGTDSPYAPLPHMRDALTNGGYVRTTSPLRRYPDILAHWQLKHHLVHGKPRFGEHDIERLLPQLERQEMSGKQLMRISERFWLHLLLQRSILGTDAGAGLLNRPLTAVVALSEVRVNIQTLTARVRVHIEELNLPADLEWETDGPLPESGKSYKVEPVAVSMAGIRAALLVRRV
ncbi:related to Exoribonuclease II [Moesziomyces antarcticus]|uniref:Related to Exoribonuclease II n=1 Tax=Pseudozyma antarctica TaxID=84753 RepID=A0A5C3FSE2_PSEA2|nr:related to Exoribonuclease II [Moesziomyces antarcticus]